MSARDDARSEAGQSNVFDLAKRGYDTRQVDGHVQTLIAQVAEAERGQRFEQGRSQQERERAERAENELAGVRARLEVLEAQADVASEQGPEGTYQGFGYRVEKLLRVAEEEAADLRITASREATTLLERAREDAEAHRHDVEQTLIARHAAVDQEATQRTVELDERERQINERTTAAQDEARRLISDARSHADQLTMRADDEVQQRREDTERAIRARQAEGEKELERLSTLRSSVRGNLGKLLDSLSGEFHNTPGPTEGKGEARTQGSSQTATAALTTGTTADKPDTTDKTDKPAAREPGGL